MLMLLAGLGLLFAGHSSAQTFTVLHTFKISEGESPNGLLLSGNTLYGTGLNGGTNGSGTVFKANTDGTGFTNLHTFAVVSSGIINGHSYNTNSDGENPGRLLLSGNTLYGAATMGGTNGSGTVFSINTDGTGFTNLYNFSILTHSTNSDGASPDGGELTISGNTLYGTALLGGANDNGTVFKINTDGTGFTNLYTFSAGTGSGLDIGNNDGARPNGTLTLSGNTLYGTTTTGGNNGAGVLFQVNTDGSGFMNFYSFTGGYDGSLPVGLLLLSGITLYGATLNGGTNGTGTLFAINTDGSEFMNLYAFSAGK
ncbi:MAG: choice-of-anchor tandem repeat GloVer-containing protein, partial [Verrucomicrobiota bacterium]